MDVDSAVHNVTKYLYSQQSVILLLPCVDFHLMDLEPLKPALSCSLPPAQGWTGFGKTEGRGEWERDGETDTEGDRSHRWAMQAFWAKVLCK